MNDLSYLELIEEMTGLKASDESRIWVVAPASTEGADDTEFWADFMERDNQLTD